MRLSLFLLLFVAIIIRSTLAEAPATTQPAGDEQQMQSWWEDLEKPDPAASRALLDFAGKPDQTVGFLRTHLTPLVLSEDDLSKAIADLGSDDESVWKPAFEKLEYLDPRLAKDLPTLMSDVNEPVARNRLVEILCDRPAESLSGKSIQLESIGDGDFNFRSANSSWWAENKIDRLTSAGWRGKKKWTRAVRAIVLLQHIGTADAMLILKDMASGNPDAEPTKVAKEALVALGVSP
jgi:hypothetical protein